MKDKRTIDGHMVQEMSTAPLHKTGTFIAALCDELEKVGKLVTPKDLFRAHKHKKLLARTGRYQPDRVLDMEHPKPTIKSR